MGCVARRPIRGLPIGTALLVYGQIDDPNLFLLS